MDGVGEIAIGVSGAYQSDQLWPPSESSIYRVPSWLRNLNSSAYTPLFVSFGPFHHGGTERLSATQRYKRDARTRFLGRADKSLDDIKWAFEGLLQDLMNSYEGLDELWRSNRGKFLDLMILDGCFMLEVLFHGYPGDSASTNRNDDYPENHPVFGRKAAYVMPLVRRDMLLIENQLPLKLLKKLIDLLPSQEEQRNLHEIILKFFAKGKLLVDPVAEKRVLPVSSTLEALFVVMPTYYIGSPLEFLFRLLSVLLQKMREMIHRLRETTGDAPGTDGESVETPLLPAAGGEPTWLRNLEPAWSYLFDVSFPWRHRPGEANASENPESAHILDLYKQSMLLRGRDASRVGRVPFSAVQLSQFGVQFQAAETGSFQDIEFSGGRHRRLGLEFFYVVPVLLLLPPPMHLPVLRVEDDTVSTILSLTAFERLHHGTGNEVNNYLLLMGCLVRSVEDVNTLFDDGIILWGPGNDADSVCKIFTELVKQALPVAAVDGGKLYSEVAEHCNSGVARIMRWVNRAKPPPLLPPILTVLALGVALFAALSRFIFK